VLTVHPLLENTVADAPNPKSFLSNAGTVLVNREDWENQGFLAQGRAPKPDYRPATKYENRGIKLGHGVWDIVFTKK